MWLDHDENCAIKRWGNGRSWCDCGMGDDMNIIDNMTDKQLIIRARKVFDDNDEIVSMFSMETYEYREASAHIYGMWETMIDLAARLEERNNDVARLSEALEGARMALGEVE